ncbi:hypothetical protein KFL_002130220 [Klebsormidium nitens]|uniref:SF3 helicase domain-containing protein n=1 Tax=Klebsormidium nitens TaxID=105231 RepID=A0A1Y1I1Z6_KLENI|nr:hypothetical protein KFL_002130220 [Klebsormidium nitens]|eukprot:GAQ84945.1 hypothetical protein KFL_002130220 [Klebsormidium nitens]
MTSTERNSDAEASEAVVDWNIESEPDSASEARDGESLERIEYEDRSVDVTNSAASLEDFLDDADSSDCGQSTMFYAALDNARRVQTDSADLLNGKRNFRIARKKRSRNNDEGDDGAELAKRISEQKDDGTLRKAADSNAEPPLVRCCRVKLSAPSQEAEAGEEANELGSEDGGQPAESNDRDDVCTDDGDDPTWDLAWDDDCDWEELRAYFSVCRIDLHVGGNCRVPASPVPSPVGGAPAQSRAEPTPPIDPILAAAHYFHGLGVVTVTHDLQEKLQKNGKVCKAPSHWASPKSWKEANLSNCLSEFAKPGRNSIAIITEVSDIYALDVDVKDVGFKALEQILKEHGGFLEDTPRLTTGNGGLHILFSLSQSEQAGLRNCCNRARICYKGQAVGIDVRGKGGMLYTAPSSYAALDGTLRRYEWDQEILPDRSNLRAVPEWLVSILNNDSEATSGGVKVPREGGKASESHATSFGPPRELEESQQTPPAAVLERVKACVAATGDNTSRFDRLKVGVSGPMYVFRVDGPRRCPYGNHHDGFNNFSVLVRKRNLLYCCNSSECQGVRPLLKIGELTRPEAMAGGETQAFRADHVTAINALHKSFVDHWAFEGDVGGSKIVAEMYASCGRLCFDGERWHYWDGRRFAADEKSAFFVKTVLINQLRIVYKRVRDELSAMIEATREEEQREALKQQLKHLRTYNNSREMGSTLELGIEYPTPLVDAFLGDIFNHDSELVDYVRKLYGYALNGNGKGVLKEVLQAATGDYFGGMSKDAVVTAPGQKSSSKNAPTNYIYELMGVRLAVTDETAEGERVDLGLLLGMTGGGKTKARCLYGNNVEFTITHTPFVQTNYPPAMSATAIKENVLRRLRVIPFPNSYVGADTFDPNNATHRRRDDGLKDRMKEEESLRQVLSWLARGSVEWYTSTDGLGRPPQAVQSATREYVTEADKLQLFLDQHCAFGEGLSILQAEFATLYREFSSERVSNEELARRMEKQGFKRLKNGTPRQLYYPKIRCEYTF